MPKQAMQGAFVPTALHAELTEYTNLVRVLRTTRTLDLTAHLLHHAAEKKGDETDTWTLWPLIDCTVPEWSLEDEIRQLGETVVRARRGDFVESDSDVGSDSGELSSAAEKRLVLHTTAVLAHVLNILADQRPAAPGSMQNRLWPMNWEDVISLLAVSGVVHPTVVARAGKRLERVYGPSTTKVMERLTSATSARARSASLAVAEQHQLFALPALPRTHRSDGKGRQRKRGVKSRPSLM